MTNASTTRQLGRSAIHNAANTPDGGTLAIVTSNVAIAHALLDVAAAIREQSPIDLSDLAGPGATAPRDDTDWVSRAEPKPEASPFRTQSNPPSLSEKIRRDLAGEKKL